jgi:hypothetical protein
MSGLLSEARPESRLAFDLGFCVVLPALYHKAVLDRQRSIHPVFFEVSCNIQGALQDKRTAALVVVESHDKFVALSTSMLRWLCNVEDSLKPYQQARFLRRRQVLLASDASEKVIDDIIEKEFPYPWYAHKLYSYCTRIADILVADNGRFQREAWLGVRLGMFLATKMNQQHKVRATRDSRPEAHPAGHDETRQIVQPEVLQTAQQEALQAAQQEALQAAHFLKPEYATVLSHAITRLAESPVSMLSVMRYWEAVQQTSTILPPSLPVVHFQFPNSKYATLDDGQNRV